MENLTVEDIVRESNGKLILGDKKFICRNFSKDTRIIEEGDIYIAIKGEKFDGNKFWKQALEKGAKAVIVQDIDFSKEDLTKYKNDTYKILNKFLNSIKKYLEKKQYKAI